MDNLVLFGAAGIFLLFLAAVILLFGIYSIAVLMYAAFVSGSYDMLLFISGSLLMIVSLYLAFGFWLHKTDRI
jgi:hypothetical protein